MPHDATSYDQRPSSPLTEPGTDPPDTAARRA